MNGLRLLTPEEKNALAVLTDAMDRCREEDKAPRMLLRARRPQRSHPHLNYQHSAARNRERGLQTSHAALLFVLVLTAVGVWMVASAIWSRRS
jgi:hypothetical protein